ncbi:Subtilase family protein [Myxococcus fulvus]|uniref:Subtilase family protein n=2 Tax=Myxococcus fulvus TaxID=33 RepID=A0A511TC09_MYXFU|nr:hypothetical protein MFU01_67530 [Myxococcus fulvus]SEU40312.1 Subtilase family protein [Myxococcus fulvus]
MSLGAYRVYEADSRDTYMEEDAEFAKMLKLAGPRMHPVTIAVTDTGIYADRPGGAYFQATEKYLRSHLAGTSSHPVSWHRKDFCRIMADGTVGSAPPVTSDSMWHGTAVAGQAAWGTDMIKLVDCRVTCDFTQNLPTKQVDLEARYVAAFDFAHARGARVVNISQSGISSNAEDSAFRDAMLKHSDMLFVGNAGNVRFQAAAGVFSRRRRDDIPNLLLVGGCTPDGAMERSLDGMTQGWGWSPELVDIAVPGDYQELYTVPGLARAEGLETYRDMGVSFGCPVASNIAAKMMLLCPSLTPEQTRKMIMASSRTMPNLKGKNRVNGMISPMSCYEAAYRRWVPFR